MSCKVLLNAVGGRNQKYIVSRTISNQPALAAAVIAPGLAAAGAAVVVAVEVQGWRMNDGCRVNGEPPDSTNDSNPTLWHLCSLNSLNASYTLELRLLDTQSHPH